MPRPANRIGTAIRTTALILMIATGASAQEAVSDSLGVESAVICESVENLEAVNPATFFPVSLGRIYCLTRIAGAEEPTQVTHVWRFGDVERARVALAVKSSSWRTYSSKAIQTHEIGTWTVEVLGPDGTVLKTMTFETHAPPKEESTAAAQPDR